MIKRKLTSDKMALEDELTFKEIEPSEIESELMKGKQEQQQQTDFSQPQQPTAQPQAPQGEQPQEARRLGFFGTLGVAFLSISNRAIGGDEIEVDNIKLLNAKTMDEMVVNEVLNSGAELDAKYMKDRSASPELRYGLSMLLFFGLKNRLGRVKEWYAAHKKKPDGEQR